LINDGKFENASFSVNNLYRKFPGKGNWFPYLTSDRQAVLSVKKDAEKGKVASIQTLANVSYAYSYIGQNIQGDVDTGVYTVRFLAKSTNNSPTYMGIYLQPRSTQENVFFSINQFDPATMETSSGALKQIRLTDEWTEYVVDFDLSKTVNGVSSLKNSKTRIKISEAKESERGTFDVRITCLTKNAGMLFTDVSLFKKE